MLCHIFKTGKHKDSNGNVKVWTVEDLDKICYQFNNVHKDVPICIGHPISSSPAYGWIDEVKRIGDNLYCSFKNVQHEFVKAFKKGLFKNRSISLDKDFNIRHIAFLGAQAPAIKGLEQFCFSDVKDDIYYEFCDLVDEISKKSLNSSKGMNQRNKEEKMDNNLKKQLDAKNSEILELKKKLDVLSNAEKVREFEDFAQTAIKNGNILPKHRECVINILSVCDKAEPFNFEDEGKKPAIDAVKDFILSLNLQNFQDVATPENACFTQGLFDAKSYAKKLEKIMKEEKVDLSTAFSRLK